MFASDFGSRRRTVEEDEAPTRGGTLVTVSGTRGEEQVKGGVLVCTRLTEC